MYSTFGDFFKHKGAWLFTTVTHTYQGSTMCS